MAGRSLRRVRAAQGAPAVDAGLARVPLQASQDAGGVPEHLLSGYVDLLAEVSLTGRWLTRADLESRRALGKVAAGEDVPMRAVIDLYLSATWLAWPLLPGVMSSSGAGELRDIGERIFRAADASIVAVAEGYERAQRLAIRREEAIRREFIDDLLLGRFDLGSVGQVAQRYGLRLAGSHVVAVVGSEAPIVEAGPILRSVETALFTRFGSHDLLVTTKEGLLVCVVPGTAAEVGAFLLHRLDSLLGEDRAWRIAVGRAHEGPGGIPESFEEARITLELGHSLRLTGRMLMAQDLLVFRVLLRDKAAITELVGGVLGPLHQARAGARPLLDTLVAYFASGGVATDTARKLGLGVRTVTYRLARVAELTGYSVGDPLQRYTLETAVLGARLLGWPHPQEDSIPA